MSLLPFLVDFEHVFLEEKVIGYWAGSCGLCDWRHGVPSYGAAVVI
jgi:hypothetical protein